VGQLDYFANQSVMGLLARLTYPGLPNRVLWLAVVLPILVYGMWRAARTARAGDEVAAIALVGIAGSLVSPVTWVHHLFWFVPALVVLVDCRRWTFAAVVYVTVSVSVVSLWEFNLGRPGGVVGFVLGNWFVWLMLALLVALPTRRQVAVET
jgi:alpha-1,2-mannosyltransferase